MPRDYQACVKVLTSAVEIDEKDPEIAGNLGVAPPRLR